MVDVVVHGVEPPSRCPTCGRSVPSVFEHIDAECQNWPDRGEPLPHVYRDFTVDRAYFYGFEYAHVDYDGPEDPRAGHETTLELVYRAIDERLDEDGAS